MKRSLLFLPGNTPNIILNGDCLGADAIILDLEDAVAPDQKDAARALVRNALKYLDFSGIETVIRVNALDSGYWKKDIDAVIALQPDFIMPPKVSCAGDVKEFDARIGLAEEKAGLPAGSVKLIPLIETALGVENAFGIASACPRVAGIFLGAEDLCADLRCKRTKEGGEIRYARSRIVVAARAAGVDAFDTPFTDVNDDEGARADAEFAASLGFSGKASISPRHVGIINSVFSPSPQDIDYAYEVMEAIAEAKEQGRGAIALRGKMIDAPIVNRARQTIEAATALGLGREG